MRIFLIVFFIAGMFGSLTKAVQLMFKSYPRTETFSLGEDCARLVEAVAFTMWAAYLIWK
jgi:hypothetical protein